MTGQATDDAAIEAAILETLARRAPGKTICPSEAARAVAAEWRPLMPRVRAAAARLVRAGRVEALRRGAPVDPEAPGGPIRLRLADAYEGRRQGLAREGRGGDGVPTASRRQPSDIAR